MDVCRVHACGIIPSANFRSSRASSTIPKICVSSIDRRRVDQSTVCFHVDDVMITCADLEMLDKFEEVAVEKFEERSILT